MVSVGRWPRGRELPLWVNMSGAFAWACFGIAVLALAYDHGDARSVISAYRLGSDRFFDLQPLYAGVMGYLYPPAFAVATEPFWLLGVPFDGMAWRVVGYAVLTYAIVRQATRLETPNRLWMISTALFFAIPVCAAAFRNGQSTILLAGACWLAVAGAMEGRPWRVAGWAAVALLAKPTALVLLLLICALRPRMILPVVGALLFVVALPFAFAPTDYVLEQTLAFGRLFTAMSTETAAAFIPSDFTAVLKVIGLPIGDGAAMLVRMVAAVATLAAVLAIAAKRRDAVGVLAIVTVGAFYTCLFNPRVECNTYAMFAPPASLAIAWMLSRHGLFSAAIIPALILSLGGLQGIHPIIQEIGRFWLAPTVSTIVMGILAWWYVSRRAHEGGRLTGAAA